MQIRLFAQRHHWPFIKPTTVEIYEVQLRHFERYFSTSLAAEGKRLRDPELTDLSAASIYGAVAHRISTGVQPETADAVLRTMRAIWTRAAELELLPWPPKMRSAKNKKRIVEAWSVEEFNRILWAAEKLDGQIGPFSEGVWFSALLNLVYNSGLRINACMSIEHGWLDISARRLIVPPEVQKDDEGSLVTLLPETIDAIRPLLSNGLPALFDDWQYDRGGRQWPALNLRLRKCIVEAGLRRNAAEVTRRDLWHKIRRTFATQIYIATGDLEKVRRMLGHSTIEITRDHYIDFSKVGDSSQADLLPRVKPMRLRIVRDDVG